MHWDQFSAMSFPPLKRSLKTLLSEPSDYSDFKK
jgi:hypothetical protein